MSELSLSPEDIARFSRHIVLPEVGAEGQQKLKSSSVLIIGAGGLGSPLALYLAAAGIGKIGLVDFDVVDLSNLQRQILHTTADVGRPKVESGMDHIRELNPGTQVAALRVKLDSTNAFVVLESYDVIIDGTDNFATRYLVNDACVLLGKPNIYGSIFRFHGQVSVFNPPAGPCYRCLYPEPPPPELVPSCAEGGVLGVLPGVIGALQATEAIKLILGKGKSLTGRMLLYDALEMNFREVTINRDPSCPVCGTQPSIRSLIDYEQFCRVRSEPAKRNSDEISVVELKERLDRKEDFDLIDVRNQTEWDLCRIPGARLIPLGDLQARIHELDPSRSIVIHCKTDRRSQIAMKQLKESGFRDVIFVRGGITAWAENIDPTIPKY